MQEPLKLEYSTPGVIDDCEVEIRRWDDELRITIWSERAGEFRSVVVVRPAGIRINKGDPEPTDVFYPRDDIDHIALVRGGYCRLIAHLLPTRVLGLFACQPEPVKLATGDGETLEWAGRAAVEILGLPKYAPRVAAI